MKREDGPLNLESCFGHECNVSSIRCSVGRNSSCRRPAICVENPAVSDGEMSLWNRETKRSTTSLLMLLSDVACCTDNR